MAVRVAAYPITVGQLNDDEAIEYVKSLGGLAHLHFIQELALDEIRLPGLRAPVIVFPLQSDGSLADANRHCMSCEKATRYWLQRREVTNSWNSPSDEYLKP